MPPKKADHRKSDVSAARFSLKEETNTAAAAAATTSTTEATSPSAPPSAPPTHEEGAEEGNQPPAGEADKKLSSEDGGDEAEAAQKDAGPASPSDKKDGAKDKESSHKESVSIEDLSLPKSIITRLAKGVLPANTQIQANAVLALSKSTTVFISYLAAHANEHTINAGKKTILPADVFKALEDTEFDFLKERLEAEFTKFTTIQSEKRTSYRNKVKASKADTSLTQDTEMADAHAADESTAPADADETSAPRSKKARIDTEAAAAGAAGAAAVGGVGAAAAATAEEHDDAETEDDDHVQDDDEQDSDVDEEDDEDEEEEEDDDGAGERSGDDTQDVLEGRNAADEHDEAVDGDDSD